MLLPKVDDGFVEQLDAFWQTYPYTVAALVCGFKASVADYIAQQQQSQPPPTTTTTPTTTHDNLDDDDDDDDDDPLHDFDVKRNVAFVVYGAFYQGIVHEYVFNHCYPVWFGTGHEWSVVATKVTFNLFVQTTLVTLPVAYLCRAWIGSTMITTKTDDDDHITTLDYVTVSTTTVANNHDDDPTIIALRKYWRDIHDQGLLWKCFALWGPVQCLTFGVVPEHLRVTFVAAVSFFWLILLSTISNGSGDGTGEITETTTTAPTPVIDTVRNNHGTIVSNLPFIKRTTTSSIR